MRIRILLPSLFAATLLTTVALADKNDDNNDSRQSRGGAVKERVMRESRSHEATERQRVQSKETTAQKTAKAPEKIAHNRGCTTEDGSGCTAKHSDATSKSTTQAKAGSAPMPSKLAQKGCATEDGSGCTSSKRDGKSKSDGTKSTTGVSKYIVQTDARSAQTANEIMKMRAEVDAKKILDMLKIKVCARSGACADDDF